MSTLRIHETRRLMVPLETAVDAVLELDQSRTGELSGARLHSARVLGLDEDDGPGLEVVVQKTEYYGKPLGLHRSLYPLSAVAAALLRYCIKSRIPVPRRAEKSIEVVADGFVLTLQISNDLVRMHGALPDARPDTPQAAQASQPQFRGTGIAQAG